MPDTPEIRLIYITTDGPEEARVIGRALVDARLAACANVLGPMTSIFRWEGAVREGEEAVLIVKTTAALVDALTAKVRELHSYDCPCIVALPVDELDQLGAPKQAVDQAGNELEAVQKALEWARDGDFLVLLTHTQRDAVMALLQRLDDSGWKAGDPLPTD